MRPSHATELAAAAAAALERLDHYENLLEELLRYPDDPCLYQRNSDMFDAMRGLTASLPEVRVCWVEILISRFELLDAVGRTKVWENADDQIARLHQKHLAMLVIFHRLCWDYISKNLVAPSPRREAPLEAPLQVAHRRLLEAERRLKRQRELIQRLEARGADASIAERILRTMEKVLEVMYFNSNVTRQRSG